MTSPTDDGRIEAALAAVRRGAYVDNPDGTMLAQSSSIRIITALLDRLDVQPGMRVLEIGTGSGYSTALLAHLVGESGHVTSIDIDPALVERAEKLLRSNGVRNVSVFAGDGAEGAPGAPALFDRVIAWTTAEVIPAAWVAQIAPEAVIVAPVQLAELAATHAVVRMRWAGDKGLVGDSVFRGGFVPMHQTPIDTWDVPPRWVDVLVRDAGERPWWLSSEWLRHNDATQEAGQRLLRSLVLAGAKLPSSFNDDEDAHDFHVWLLARQPTGLTTAALGEPTWLIGHAHPAGAAFLNASRPAEVTHVGDPQALETLTSWIETWRSEGHPGYADLLPVAADRTADGYTIRLQLNIPPGTDSRAARAPR